MKKLLNRVDDVVVESLAGLAAAHPCLVKLHPSVKAVLRADAPGDKVAVVSGGGSGHEPLHGGYVGYGMLDAACPGEVFTSPTPDQMYEAAKAVDGGKGVLFIVKNYTGDVMNFQMAADMLAGEGIAVEQVVVDDDVAVQDSLYTAGRRGVGGTVLIEKIVGAKAGRRILAVKSLCEGVNTSGPWGCPDVLRGARRRQAHVRARRGRDGDRHRNPRGAGAQTPKLKPAKEIRR